MDMIFDFLNGFFSVYDNLQRILEFDPFLILTVFLVVAAVRGAMGERLPNLRRSLLPALCLGVSFLVLWLAGNAPGGNYVKNSMVLGTLTSFTYNLFKGAAQWAVDWLIKKMEESTGKDYDDPELPL